MPMQKLGGNFLSEEDVVQYGSKWKIVSAPELKEVEYKGKKSKKYEITIHPITDRNEKRTWQMNPTSSNYLQTLLGNDEGKWVGKEIEIEVKNQIIEGEEASVIYAKGAVKKKSG